MTDDIDPEVQELLDNGIEGELYGEDGELLFDPAPRRHGHKHRRGRSKSSHRGRGKVRAVRKGSSTVLVYDPAPRSKGHYRKRAKDFLSKYQDLVIPGTAGITFYAAYVKRAKDLFGSGAITKDSVVDAIMYDLKNIDGTEVVDRLKANAGSILIPGIGGIIAKAIAPKTKKAKPYVNLIGNILIGLSVGMAGKTILDPPMPGGSNSGAPANRTIVVKKIEAVPTTSVDAKVGCPQCSKWEV